MNYCIHNVTGSLQVLFQVIFLELVILHWCHGLGENAESGIWQPLGTNIKDNILFSKNIYTDEEEGNVGDQDGVNVADIFANYQDDMPYNNIKEHNDLVKRGIKELRGKNKRRKLKYENENFSGDTGDSLIGTIIDNPDKIQGPLKDLISKYSEAHKHMHNNVHRNPIKSLGAETKTNNKSNPDGKVLIKSNKYGDKKGVVSNNYEYLFKQSGSNAMSSVLKGNTDGKNDDSNYLKLKSTNNFGEVKNIPKHTIVYNGEESKANLRNRKKTHRIKEIPENNLGGYTGEVNSGKKESSDDIRRKYINRLIKIKPIGEYNTSDSENELYANMSLINEGFLNAVEKKYFSINNGALTKFKSKPSIDVGLNFNKPESTDFQKNNRVLNNNNNENAVFETAHSNFKLNITQNKNISGGKYDNVHSYLETRTHANKPYKNILGNNSLEQGKPMKSAIIISADIENSPKGYRHHNHETDIKNGHYAIENKDYMQTTAQRFEETQNLKVKLQDTHTPRNASHLISENNEKLNTFLNSNDKRNRTRLHRKVVTGYSLKEPDSLNTHIKKTNIAKKEVISKKSHLAKAKDHSKRRNQRAVDDVENKNPKLRKYRIGVDSRGRSRLMISDVDENNNSGHLSTGFQNSKQGVSKRNIIRPNNHHQYQTQYFNDPVEEEVNDINYNDDDNAYDEGNANEDDSDEEVDVKKVFARRAHHPKFNNDAPTVTDCCVEYKGEQDTSSSKTTKSSVTFPTTEKPDTQSCSTKRKSKETTTPKTNGINPKSKSADIESADKNSTYYSEVDDYEKYLTGVLADNFVSAVLAKVQRSRKMAKELGFGNDTDESSDRCLETKLNKMPDLEVLRKSLNSLPKCSQKKNSQLCYRVPEPMNDFLLLLVLYEKEQESSVYRNIQDESNFIFTGDYPESPVREAKTFGNDKYDGEKDSIGKDPFEKQRLHEEENEDKNDDHNLIRNNIPLSDTLRPGSSSQEEGSNGNINNENGDIPHGETKKRKGKKVVHMNKMNLSPQDEHLKGNDLDSSHRNPPSRSRYNHYVDPENVFNTNNAKHRRQSYKIENVPSLSQLNGQSELDNEEQHNRANTGKSNHFPNPNYYGIPNTKINDNRNVQNNRLSYDYSNSHIENNNNLVKDNVLPPNEKAQDNHYAKPNKLYEYPQESWAEGERVNPSIHRDPQYFISDDVLSNGEEEYQLYPNFNGDDIPLSPMSDYRYHKNDYGRNSRMVKRDTDPSYDYDFLFFEVPDVEYDLY